MLKKKLLVLASISFLLLGVAGCNDSKVKTSNVIKVGTIAGPETELMQVAKTVAAREYNLDIKIVPFTDYNQPNEALSDGSIDANVFQHLPYLQQAIAARHYKLISIGKTFVYPMGIYSKRYQHLAEIPKGSTVAIPNDPSNEARALLLLQNAKLISLKDGGNSASTPMDVLDNPYQLKIISMDAAQLSRALSDVAVAVINTNYAVPAGLLPNRDALYVEGKDSPYANLIVVRADMPISVNDQRLVEVLHSPEVLETANKLFNGQAVPAW